MTEKEVRPAGFSERLLAHNIDLVPILFILYLGSFVLPNVGYDWLFFSLIYIIYNVGFETSKLGATPGKKWAKIGVTSENGSLTFLQSLLRNTSKAFSLILFFGGYILMFFNVRKKALHDYISRTSVIFDED